MPGKLAAISSVPAICGTAFGDTKDLDLELGYAGLGKGAQERDPLLNSEVLGLRLKPSRAATSLIITFSAMVISFYRGGKVPPIAPGGAKCSATGRAPPLRAICRPSATPIAGGVGNGSGVDLEVGAEIRAPLTLSQSHRCPTR